MPLDFSHVPVQIGGINTKTDDKQLQAGALVVAENVLMQKTGKVQSRPGYAFTSTPVTHTSEVITAVASGVGNIGIERDGDVYFDELNSSNKVGTWNKLATVQFEQTQFPFVLQSFYANHFYLNHYSYSTSATHNTFVYMIGDAIYDIYAVYTTYNVVTGLIEYANRINLGADVSRATVCAFNGDSFAVTGASSNNTLVYKLGSLYTTWASGRSSALDFHQTTSKIVGLAKASNGGTLNLGIFDIATTTWAANIDILTAGTSCTLTFSSVWANETAGEVYACYQDDTSDDYIVKIYSYAGALLYSWVLAGTTNTTKLSISVNPTDLTKVFIVHQTGSTVTVVTCNKADGAVLSTYTAAGMELASKVAYPYMVTKNVSTWANSAYFICDMSGPIISTTSIAALCSYSYGEAAPQQDAVLLDVAHPDNMLVEINDNIFPNIKFNPKNGIGSTDPSYSLLVGHIKANFTTNKAQSIPWNNSIVTNAWGSLRTIDTNNTDMPLWSSWPIAGWDLTLTGGAGTLAAGTYTYVLVLEAIDSNGNVTSSSPLLIKSHTLAAPGSIAITYTTPANNSFFSANKYKTAIYRTEADGDLFYFLAYSLVTDQLADTSLIANKALYTTGGLIDSSPAPLASSISLAKNRLWIVTPESNELVYFSKKQFPKEAPQFNSYFVVKVQSTGGNLVTCAEMDDKIIIFRQNAIYATYGEGPDETGAGSFADPQLITQSMGCKYAQSVVLTDAGLLFMSYEGIWLVTRGLQLQYIGSPVEAHNALEITGALNLVDRHQVWFTSATGTTLVWDDVHGLWYTFVNEATYAPFLTNTGVPSYYRAIAASKYPGRLMVEDATKYYDGASDNPITIGLETGWVNLAGLQSFQRLRKLTWIGKLNDTLTIKSYFNFEAALNETFTVTTTASGTSPAQYQVIPKQQKCESMKWSFAIASLTGPFELSGLGIEAGMKRSTFKVNQSKRVQGV